MLTQNNLSKKAFMTDVEFIKNQKQGAKRQKAKEAEARRTAPFKQLRSQEIKSRKGRTRLPQISSSSKHKKIKGKTKENISRDLRSFVGSFNREFKMKRGESRDPKNVYTNNHMFGKKAKIDCVENFLDRQEKKTRKNMKSVYLRLAKNSEKDVFDLLSRMENKTSFKQLLKMKEDELIITKKKFNQLSFNLKKAKETLKGLDRQVKKEQLELVDRTDEGEIDQAIRNERQLDDDIEEIRLVTESLIHKKKMYSADILTQKKNTETLKTLLRRWKKIRSDLTRKKNTNIKLSNHLLEKIICEKKKRDEVSEVFGNSNNLKNLFHDELELFRDKIILEEMIKKKDDDGTESGFLTFRFPGVAAAGATQKGNAGEENEGQSAQEPGADPANRETPGVRGRAGKQDFEHQGPGRLEAPDRCPQQDPANRKLQEITRRLEADLPEGHPRNQVKDRGAARTNR